MAYFGDTRQGRKRDDILAGLLVLAGVVLLFLPRSAQDPIRGAIRSTALWPFVAAQSALATSGVRREDPAELQAQRDSLAVIATAQSPLAEENRRLRSLLDLQERLPASFVPAEVLRIGLGDAGSTFLISRGRDDGVAPDSPVIAAGGLLGVVVAVDGHTAQAMDWTDPEFRASAMTVDGRVYGVVQPRRGAFREADQLVLSGAPFHSDLRPGTRIVTSGRGGVFPRGIPVGTVVGIEDADTGWRKSYVLQAAVRPESAGHVLVGVPTDSAGAAPDLSGAWPGTRGPSVRVLRTDSAGGPS